MSTARTRTAWYVGAFLASIPLAACGAGNEWAEGASDDESGSFEEEEAVGTVGQEIGGSKATSSYQNEVVMVSLVTTDPQRATRGVCSGAIIASRVVLTAAHCLDQVYESPGDFLVRIHAGRRSADSSTKVYDVSPRTITSVRPCPGKGSGGIARHPKYRQGNRYDTFDVAVVVADEAIAGSSLTVEYDAPPAFINGFNVNPAGYLGRRSIAVGYGYQSNASSKYGERRESATPIAALVGDFTAGSTFAALAVPGGIVCHGDSGGPLIQITPSGYERLVGVAGWGRSEDKGEHCPSIQGYYQVLKPVKDFVSKWDGNSSVGGICP